MTPTTHRLLTGILIWQQLVFALPARAENVQAGKPLDAAAFGAATPSGGASEVGTNLFTGDATFQVPVTVPPGTGGHTPAIGLSYSSAAVKTNGPLGVGWSLDIGPAMIERSTRNGAPRYDDAEDSFTLGGQDLVETGTVDRFVSENHDFQRIERLPGQGDYWRVLRTDGTRLYYGYDYDPAPVSGPPNDSRLHSSQVDSFEGTPAVCPFGYWFPCFDKENIIPSGIPFAWYLDRVEDRNGNSIHFRWESLGDPGVRYLVEVTYSGHVAGAVNAVPDFGGGDDGTLTRTRTLTFGYELRADQIPTYRTGFQRQFTNRLNDITVEVDAQLVRHYVLEYEQSPASGRSRLVTVRDRGADDSATTEFVQTFGYGNGGASGWSAKDASYALPAGLTFVSGGQDNGIRLLDVNGDAYPDVVRADSGTRNTYLGGPTGFNGSASATWALPANLAGSKGYTGATLADLDADGRPDLIRRRLDVTGTNVTSGSCGTSRQHEVGTLSSSAFVNTGAGWTSDPAHDPGSYSYTTEPDIVSGSAQSCPTERLNTASELLGVSARFDQGTRLTDLDGDGRADLIFKRALSGTHPEGSELWYTTELRAGTLINGPAGLAAGTFNNAHEGDVFGDTSGTDVFFGKRYDLPEWQPPFLSSQGVFWSNFNTCKSSSNANAGAHSGKERLVDLNGDGLPEILEAAVWFPCTGCSGFPLTARSINNGYGWKFVSFGTPEPSFGSPYFFYSATSGFVVTNFFFPGPTTQCEQVDPGDGEDFGVRIVDINGDGGPDMIGGGNVPRLEAALWDATVPLTGSVNSLWRLEPSWDIPVPFAVANGQDSGLRLADVDADGMIDILASDGAYLNLGEPPDRLETVSSPWGASTTVEYAPHTIFDDFTTPPETNPTVDGQRRLDRPRWVVTAIETDPGFGQPGIRREFDYEDGVYDVEDRSFRGFSKVTSLGPIANDVRRVTETTFHSEDALRGRPAETVVSSAPAQDPGNRTMLNRVEYEYARASGDDAEATVIYVSDPPVGLNSVDPVTQSQAFDPFTTLMSGSPQASDAHLAFVIGTEVEVAEGTASPVFYRREQSFDAYGNLTEARDLGDRDDPDDDLTTTRSFALLDQVVGSQHVLLADRIREIVESGSQGGLPAGTVLSRTVRFLYDGLTPGAVNRGNPTAAEQDWQGGTKVVQVFRAFDVYGNRVTLTSPYDVANPQDVLLLSTAYDLASQTHPISLAAFSLGPPAISLQSTYEYELAGCGGPVGMGLICRSVDGSGRATDSTYDTFGRQIGRSAPNGAAFEIDYHDSDRGTVDQRTERRTRWDPAAPASPLSDPDAIATELYYDGLRRMLKLKRPGIGTATANRTASYDAAGRLAASTRWESDDIPGPSTTYSYDALGRILVRTRADGTLQQLAYEPRKLTVTSDEPTDGIVHRRIEHYDGKGRLAEVEEFEDPAAGSVSTTYRYDPFDQLVIVNNPVAVDPSLCGGNTVCENQVHTTEVLYDELGNRTRLVDPDAGTILTTYDARGLIETEQDARGFIQEFTIDALGRLLRRHAQNPASSETDDVFSYGVAGVHGPNQIGRLVRVDDTEGYAEFDYDAAGNLSWHRRVTDGRQFDFTRSFDPLGRVLDTTYPDGEVVTWHYDKRLLERVSNAGGGYGGGDYVASVSYDPSDRVVQAELGRTAGAPVLTESWSYDPTSGRLTEIGATSVTTSVATLSYSIDGVGRVRTLQADLASTGVPTIITTRNFSYEYDGLDRLVQTTGNYTALDPLLTTTFDYDHDVLGNLDQKDSDADAGIDDGWAISYQDPTRPHAATTSVHETGYPTRAFGFDASGNVTSKLTQASASDPLLTATLTYDSVGRLTGYQPEAGPVWAMGYDAFGRRVFSKKNAATLSYPEPNYEYHHGLTRVNKHFFLAGRRVASSKVTWTAPLAGTPPATPAWQVPAPPSLLPIFWLVYAGLFGLAVARSARGSRWPMGLARLRRFTPLVLLAVLPFFTLGGNCGSSPNAMGTHGEAGLFYVTDHVGSTVATVRGNGNVRNLYQYRPFGDPVLEAGVEIHHTFAGEDLGGSGLIALGARYYDPELGRFLQPDPIVPDVADPQSLNPYSYVLNNPLNLIDPSGLMSESPAPRSEGGGGGFEFELTIWERFWDIWDYLGGSSAPPPPVPTAPNTTGEIPNAGTNVVRDPILGELEQVGRDVSSGGFEAAVEWVLDQVRGRENSIKDPQVTESVRKAAKGSAAVIAVVEILKGLFGPAESVEPTDPGSGSEAGPYGHIEDPTGVAPGKDFSANQKRRILDENRSRNAGRLRDDDTGRFLSQPQKSQRGVTPSRHEAQVDHIVPRNPADPSVSPGTNSYGNAKVISRERNREKSNKLP